VVDALPFYQRLFCLTPCCQMMGGHDRDAAMLCPGARTHEADLPHMSALAQKSGDGRRNYKDDLFGNVFCWRRRRPIDDWRRGHLIDGKRRGAGTLRHANLSRGRRRQAGGSRRRITLRLQFPDALFQLGKPRHKSTLALLRARRRGCFPLFRQAMVLKAGSIRVSSRAEARAWYAGSRAPAPDTSGSRRG
jgi:hypothetical protein